MQTSELLGPCVLSKLLSLDVCQLTQSPCSDNKLICKLANAMRWGSHISYPLACRKSGLTVFAHLAQIMCGCWNDEAYRRDRCPDDMWQKMYGKHNIKQVWYKE